MAQAKLMEIAAASDPKEGIMKAIGDLTDIAHLFSCRVLVAIYIAPEKTAGGIIRPNSNVSEDVWQGSVGLVLKKGARAFEDDDHSKFYGQTVNVGDWVLFRPGDSKRVQINGVDCRIVEDTVIDMVIERPDILTHRKVGPA